MKSRDELDVWLERLTEEDLPAARGLAVLLERADDQGRLEKNLWSAAVRAGVRADEGGPDGAPVPSVEDPAVVGLSRLEAAGIVEDAADADGTALLRVPPQLWEDVRADTDRVVARLQAVIDHARDVRRAAGARIPRTVAPPEDGSRLWAEGLTKIYRKRKVVNDVDISVRQGEIVGLLGPNGAGKTTTFYQIVGLIPPDAGRVYLDDDDITETPMFKRARRGIGYLAQEPSIFRKLTVEENVLAILETLDLPRKEEKERLEGLLEELSIAHLRESKAYSLSGGERRRLEITRALVQRPKFMLLDEPFAGIDPIAVNDIQQIVGGLKHRGIGVIISDHNVEQTLEIVDRAYIMYEGRIRVAGTVSELVWNDEVAEIYLGPVLTQRMRARFPRPGERTPAGSAPGTSGAGLSEA